MDGYEEMVKTEAWKKLLAAQEAAYELQAELARSLYRSEETFEARCALNRQENQLRHFFKKKAQERPIIAGEV